MYTEKNGPKLIDFVIKPRKSFYMICVFETDLFDFCKIVLTILRSKLESLTFKIIRYWTYKQFDDEEFKTVFQKY